jgi:hypothetical protein
MFFIAFTGFKENRDVGHDRDKFRVAALKFVWSYASPRIHFNPEVEISTYF